MLKAFALNPTSDRRRFTTFPPPECEICGGDEHAESGHVLTALLLFLEQSRVVRELNSATAIPFPEEWQDLPGPPGIEEVALPGHEVREALRQLDGYQLDQAAFLSYWIRFLYGRGFKGQPSAGDVAAADVAPQHLQFVK